MAERWTASMVSCPWSATAGSTAPHHDKPARPARGLYTPEERLRRDATGWTMVQGVLAPIQFLVFLISLGLVLNYLAFGTGYAAATASVVIKTGLLYLIMVTGSIWEKKVFGKYLFARAFFYEDLVSMLVIALHTAYIMMLLTGHGSAQQLMILALAAYASYAINATQFLLKLRAARLEAATLGARA
jgi:3-vinyl bacteriochlorophyllide hydratase